jgi:4-alpha-glucanotransferase
MITIHFYLKFSTKPGQQLYIQGNHTVFSSNEQKKLPLSYFNDELWYAQVTFDKISEPITYNYVLADIDGNIIYDAEQQRTIDVKMYKQKAFIVSDSWNHAGFINNAFETAPFKTVLTPITAKEKKLVIKTQTHIFKVKCPLLAKDEQVCILGSGAAMHEWDTAKPILLQPQQGWYVGALQLDKENFPIAYKYGIYNNKTKTVWFEEGGNRTLYAENDSQHMVILHDGFVRMQRFYKGAGVAIPVFSLRSKNGFGIGEFADIASLADWASASGMSLIQILPVNDTTVNYTFKDSYPYSAISAFALHPIYINLEILAGKQYAALLKPYAKKKKQLNEAEVVLYDEVITYKRKIIEVLYEVLQTETFASEDYKQWFDTNAYWAKPYAAFCYLRDKYSTSDFNTWKTHSTYDAKAIEKLFQASNKNLTAIRLHLFVQYHLHVQLKDAVVAAHKKGVIIKGDIPIGISRNSCDAWVAPSLYNMDAQAGAPPDAFAVKGQNWSFPTYNWKQMQQDGFSWWHKRFEQMRAYFDAFRIDHILGFFRIWSIPTHAVEGIMGHFVPAIPIHINELHEQGIWFDYNRFCKPYITESLLYEFFGTLTNEVIHNYFDKDVNHYTLKEFVATQVQVATHFETLPKTNENAFIKSKLFDVISNVIFFEEPESNRTQFHFRIDVETTTSFMHLSYDNKQKLKALYIDYYYKRQDDFWRKEAWSILPALKQTTNMLICGEDLGMVPGCVPDVMAQLGLLSLEIQRMPKNPTKTFFHPADAPYLSVVTPSTHDMSTIRGWWEEDKGLIQKFFNQELGQYGEAPLYCEPEVNLQIVLQHLYSPAMWCIFQWQDWLGIHNELRRANPNDERINVPADPNNYWQYRMHIAIEDLIKNKNFTATIHDYILKAGRGNSR